MALPARLRQSLRTLTAGDRPPLVASNDTTLS
jgi:hypothetical protein